MKFFCIPASLFCRAGPIEQLDFSQLRLEQVPKEIFKARKHIEELLLNVNSIEEFRAVRFLLSFWCQNVANWGLAIYSCDFFWCLEISRNFLKPRIYFLKLDVGISITAKPWSQKPFFSPMIFCGIGGSLDPTEWANFVKIIKWKSATTKNFAVAFRNLPPINLVKKVMWLIRKYGQILKQTQTLGQVLGLGCDFGFWDSSPPPPPRAIVCIAVCIHVNANK